MAICHLNMQLLCKKHISFSTWSSIINRRCLDKFHPFDPLCLFKMWKLTKTIRPNTQLLIQKVNWIRQKYIGAVRAKNNILSLLCLFVVIMLISKAVASENGNGILTQKVHVQIANNPRSPQMPDRSWITVFFPTPFIFRYYLPLRMFSLRVSYFGSFVHKQELRISLRNQAVIGRNWHQEWFLH